MTDNTINDGYYICTPAYGFDNTIHLKVNKEAHSCIQAPVPDLSSLPNVDKNTRISLSGTFSGNRKLCSIAFTDWTHKTIVSLSSAFKGCSNLHSIKGFEQLDLSACNDYQDMCCDCSSLREIDLSNRYIKTWSWELRTKGIFDKCPVLQTAVITPRTPKFAFPSHTTIIDLDAGVNRIFSERITALEQRLSSKDYELETLRMEVDVLRRQLSGVLSRLTGPEA